MKITGTQIAIFSAIAVVVLFLTVLLVGVVSYITNHNYGNRAEQTIVAEHKNLKNILGQYSLKISEAAQIPKMQSDDLVKIFTRTLPARYGKDGSQAAFQWIQEQNPALDQTSYTKIQQLIEAGRNKFENSQTKFIDTKRVYKTALGYFWKGLWLKIAGYPKINLDDYTIVTSQYAEDSFETGIDKGLKLRPE